MPETVVHLYDAVFLNLPARSVLTGHPFLGSNLGLFCHSGALAGYDVMGVSGHA